MGEGDIVEQGKHEDLLARDGIYAGLYNSQFEQPGEVSEGEMAAGGLLVAAD